MKIRILSIACVTTAATLLAACTAVYKNTDACEQLMRSKLAETSSPDTLKITHTGAGIDGSRVVVEGSIEHVVTASEVAAASAPSPAASAAPVANAPRPASGARAASVASGAERLRRLRTRYGRRYGCFRRDSRQWLRVLWHASSERRCVGRRRGLAQIVQAEEDPHGGGRRVHVSRLGAERIQLVGTRKARHASRWRCRRRH